ncbi:putative ATP-dependent RNA helicase chl1 [Paratrimastix pyriformis]|uniref:ATP-dependent RNA helicase chl1 n=1 Tax=Paratrimastix pyriformis TaxID=342808 RepID=A0ABQ8U2B0_9EUKA|nr:putative ATP-dependent RNA helicase chl1 [Paratrimastix pyriformis]
MLVLFFAVFCEISEISPGHIFIHRTEGATLSELGLILCNLCHLVPDGLARESAADVQGSAQRQSAQIIDEARVEAARIVAAAREAAEQEALAAAQHIKEALRDQVARAWYSTLAEWLRRRPAKAVGLVPPRFNPWRLRNFFFLHLPALAQIFVEPRQGSETSALLSRYRAAIDHSWTGQRPQGAALFCVVGGKLSEGINFSDGYARCVCVVGLPYPDPRDPILAAQMKSADEAAPGAGKSLYQDLCMRAVNQSIGL